MATIITKNSQTASAVPSAASLAVGELAVNTADGKLYTEHTGGVVKEIIPSTVVDGGITEAKIASNAVTTAKIADANVTGAKLENSGVTAGTYTTATVTVDAKGRVTSASSGSGGGVTSLNGQTGAIVDTNLYAIGSYISARPPNITTYAENTTIAGSSLRIVGTNVVYSRADGVFMIFTPWDGNRTSVGNGTNPNVGTWRCVSAANAVSEGASPGLWVRIS